MPEKTQILPFNEKLRRAALAEYAIVRSGPDRDYDELTSLAAQICQVPAAHVGIIGKRKIWFKSEYGTFLSEIPRESSFCEQAIRSDRDILVYNSDYNPEIFKNVRKLYGQDFKFFAGIPLVNPYGHAIAVFSIFDTRPRELSEDQERALKALANQTMNLFEFRKQNNKLQHVQRKLKQKYAELERFASLVSHDIKSPLANIISLTELLRAENEGKFSEETDEYLNFLVESSYSLRNYVDGILSFYRSDHVFEKDYENVNLHQLLKRIADLYKPAADIEITYPESGTLKNVNRNALTQVFMNLISNALKYNNKKLRKVEIGFRESEECYCFTVKDNGNGIAKEHMSKIFNLFTTLDTTDRNGNPGSGIGLATVKKHIENMHGRIEVESEPGVGSTFKFKIKRH